MTTHLRPLADDLYAWLPEKAGWGLSNCALLVGAGEAAWIDSPYDQELAEQFLALSRPLLPAGTGVDWLIATHGNGDHLWGGAAVLPDVRVVYTRETGDHIAHEPEPDALHAMVHNSDPDTVLGWFLRRNFGRYHWAGLRLPAPALTFRGEIELSVGGVPVQVQQLGPAHTVGDALIHLPRQGVCFSGDVIFASSPEQHGDHPVHWAGPLAGVVEGCRAVLATGAEVIVPGHGPVLDRAGVHRHIAYLEHLQQRAAELHAAGYSVLDAARQVLAENRDPELGLRERLAVTLGTEFAHLSGEPGPSMLEHVAAMAQLSWELEGPAALGGGAQGALVPGSTSA